MVMVVVVEVFSMEIKLQEEEEEGTQAEGDEQVVRGGQEGEEVVMFITLTSHQIG